MTDAGQVAHQHTESVFIRCKNCLLFGTPMPRDMVCGNCGSSDTVAYAPPCCVQAATQQGRTEMYETLREAAAGKADEFMKGRAQGLKARCEMHMTSAMVKMHVDEEVVKAREQGRQAERERCVKIAHDHCLKDEQVELCCGLEIADAMDATAEGKDA